VRSTLLIAAAVMGALTVGVPAVGVPAAGAHTALTATDPAAESALSTGPTRVTATFNEPLQPTFAAMTVVGPDGNLWSSGEAEVDGATVTVMLRPLGPAGTYTANYRVTSADGHVVSGSWSFSVTAAGTGQPGPAVQASGHDDRIPLWPLAVGGAVLIAGAVMWAMRRGRTG
jgi:methionine-rich copper-binding protein CopC